jgi:ATP-dependent DNA helicase RecG
MSQSTLPSQPPKGRPFILDPLFRRINDIAGVGPRLSTLYAKLCGGDKILDLIWHHPIDFIDRRYGPDIINAEAGHIITIKVIVDEYKIAQRRNLPTRVHCHDKSGPLDLVFFNMRKDVLEKTLPIGATIVVSGKVDFYNGRAQIVHPDAMGSEEDYDEIARIEPIYPLTAGLTNKLVRKTIGNALDRAPSLPEWLDEAFVQKNKFPNWRDAVYAIHNIQGENALHPLHPARARIAYDELLAGQLALAIVRNQNKKQKGREFAGDGRLRALIRQTFPYQLTGAQERALNDIYADMAEPLRMLRLVQGDVGSGKTIVAALAMANVIECGAQAALMAPTEILARQHAESLKPLFDAAGIRYAVLTGRNKGKERTALLEAIASGETQIVIGTHALFQDDVQFQDLGCAVIDEQHRFGVQQRLQLSNKGRGTDVLVMTATPIPRTLTLTAYGDMDVSRLDEKPPGRKPIDTRLIPTEKIDNVIDGIARQMEEGARVYWVCPLVEESEFMDLAAAQERYEILQARFGDKVGLVHGKMKAAEKDAVMAQFSSGEKTLLIATTVIEVGVNVPEATIMIIEHAERFGLAQLHQLRGRVGRGGEKSFCFLLYSTPTGKIAKERLSTMRDTEDGFIIAEADLALRGAGDILGTQQSGEINFRIADLMNHAELLAAARDDARYIVEMDPTLSSERGQKLRILLYLFERDQAIQNLRSG